MILTLIHNLMLTQRLESCHLFAEKLILLKMKLKFLFFTLFICAIGFSQDKGTITGILLDKDSNNQPLPFANVLIKGTKTGANTDVEGKYTITVAPGNY